MKIAFAGFGEVNTPIDIIINKCKAASASLACDGVEVISHFPITDDYEEKDVNAAIDFFKGKKVFLTEFLNSLTSSGVYSLE